MIEVIEKYNIIVDNIYNFDEKDFLIDVIAAIKRIMTFEAYESDRIIHVSHDDSRKFINFLACLCVNDTALLSLLIYRNEAIQDFWLKDLNNEQTFFAFLSIDWNFDEFEYKWLTQIFDRCTKKHFHRNRLLIINNDFNHVNIKFINKCDELRILLMILSFYIIHRSQSLIVSLFVLLTRYYINDFNAMMNNSLEIMSMSKRIFWSVLWSVWQQIFTVKNIAFNFEKTDKFFFDSDAILNQIMKKKLRASTSENIDDSQTLKILLTDRAVRRIQKVYENQSNKVLLFKIFTVNQRLAVKDSINQHVIRDLLDALKNEKKRRNRNKKLNLLDEQNSKSQFFSSDRVQTIKIYQAAKNEEKSRKQKNIAEKRAQIIANKSWKIKRSKNVLWLLQKSVNSMRSDERLKRSKSRLKKSWNLLRASSNN